MAKKSRIKLDKKGIQMLMYDRGIVDEVHEQAERLAARAGQGYEARYWGRATKSVSNVVDTREGGMSREARTGQLARAVTSLGR